MSSLCNFVQQSIGRNICHTMAIPSRSLIFLALIGVALAAKGSSVRHLNSKDFEEVTSDGKVYFVK